MKWKWSENIIFVEIKKFNEKITIRFKKKIKRQEITIDIILIINLFTILSIWIQSHIANEISHLIIVKSNKIEKTVCVI